MFSGGNKDLRVGKGMESRYVSMYVKEWKIFG